MLCSARHRLFFLSFANIAAASMIAIGVVTACRSYCDIGRLFGVDRFTDEPAGKMIRQYPESPSRQKSSLARPIVTVALLIVGSYFVGSLPFGLWTAKLVRGVDIRTLGSGNIGATNVGREIGWKWGGFVLFLDALKGLFPTLAPLWLTSLNGIDLANAMVGCGFASCIGHMFPIYLRFKGGKGVATGLGVAAAIAPQATLAAFITFVVLTLAFRMVGLSSVVAAIVYAIAETFIAWDAIFQPAALPLLLFSYGIPLLIVVRHRSNIARILSGTEPRTFGNAPANSPAKLDQERRRQNSDQQ